ncbi:hypothetical protein SAMN00768000_3621 [Sulfobacillus thermosulfidooxidans DSM 9293]|uniref:Uncharacterized protein n=1 Tax=Sulfobacillus thermosulfidooxidans (strain DSM 9293 / VKM B-1269 / AT-1) TaxID=929705 RepID=A0A1W1WPB2_SULTA|nr:hypothetical protein [Sulfobacillus thermosulfidooxidans]SMC08055.1 hypothetical protein SAMN00768000_3621 [Sulfobacillus thermosulfidooxidans DSM 9293]
MPYATFWMPPAVVLVHRGIPVYHAYRADDYDDPLIYGYTLNPLATEYEAESVFDIRDFPVADYDPTDPRNHPAILRALLEDPVWFETWRPDSDSANQPLYQLRCPHCTAENPVFQVIAATFQHGPAITRHGALLTPDDTPETVTIRCLACHTAFPLSDLPLEPPPSHT